MGKIADLQPKKDLGTPSRHLYALNPVATRGGTVQSARRPTPSLRNSASAQGTWTNVVPTNVVRAQRKRMPALQMSVGLYYSTSTGNTETVAEYIATRTGIEDYKDIADAD